MNVTVIVELKIKPDQLEKVEPLFASLLHETRGRPGNQGVTVHRDQDDALSVILIEHWASRDQYETYNRWRAERGDLATLAQLLQAPPQRRFFDHVNV